MKEQKEKTPIRKNRKIRYSFSISEDVIDKLNDKIGYGSRSKVIESIISHYLDNKKTLIPIPGSRSMNLGKKPTSKKEGGKT